jgi:hypothetical protein
MEEKIDKIVDKLTHIEVTLAKQQVILQEHMKRSEANEKAIEILKEEQKPVKELMIKINFIHKSILWVGGILAALHGLLKIISMR